MKKNTLKKQRIGSQWKAIQDVRENGLKMQKNGLNIKRQNNSY